MINESKCSIQWSRDKLFKKSMITYLIKEMSMHPFSNATLVTKSMQTNHFCAYLTVYILCLFTSTHLFSEIKSVVTHIIAVSLVVSLTMSFSSKLNITHSVFWNVTFSTHSLTHFTHFRWKTTLKTSLT